jgi:hypothetical protein
MNQKEPVAHAKKAVLLLYKILIDERCPLFL